ncbi:PAS domain-containing protein [Streptomyces sp. TP-A0874]|uniref:PAS domain-containing protein n=1 Tax=Streptomyces sp. TP-A0874 TaxID=549819 RepID=UPI000853B257|nr:PAS domain-containing protein [Streptomyces sp. TP-A0874]
MTASLPSGPDQGRSACRCAAPADAAASGLPGRPDPTRAATGAGGDCPPDHRGDRDLLTALVDGMDAGLCAFDAQGVITHWNREAERLLGWSAAEAVGRQGFGGWALRPADAGEVAERLLGAMSRNGRQVDEFALLARGGGRVLIRAQTGCVRDAGGRPAGVYCAFTEVQAQIELERSIALSEALFEDASWGVVLVDADLRPALVNGEGLRSFGQDRESLLGRPLGELLTEGAQELEGAFQQALVEEEPPGPAEFWVTLRGPAEPLTGEAGAEPRGNGSAVGRRRCWRSGFVRLSSPLAQEPVPLGVGWFFQDVTEARRREREAAVLRFRSSQLHRAGLAAAECEDPAEAATVHLDFALAGFADRALLDLLAAAEDGADRLVRVAATPVERSGRCSPALRGGAPVGYPEGHPALQAVERTGAVRTSWPGTTGARAPAGTVPGSAARWASLRYWPEGSVHALCTVLRSRGRTLGVLTFLRGDSRRAFDRSDALYAEDVAVRAAVALDLARSLPGGTAGRRGRP